MEGLIIIVAELLMLPFIVGITALCELALGLASLVLQIVFGVALKQPKEKKIKIPPALIKWIQRIAIISVTLFATAILLINFVFLEETVRFAADKVEEKTGFEIQYDSVEGNVFTGAFAFAGLDLKQTLSDKPQLSVKAQTVAANLSVWHFILGSRVIDSATLSNAEITLETLPKAKEEKGSLITRLLSDDGTEEAIAIKIPFLSIPRYTIKDLQLSDVRIHVDDRSADTPTTYDITITTFRAQPLRSHYAIFDLLFRSNLDGTLNGSRLEISNTEINGQRHTKWATSNVSVATLGSLMGGPFSLFEKGTVDVEVTDQWESKHVSELELNWKIKVADAQARLPDATSDFLKPYVQVWVDNINENQKDWEFSFQLQFSEDQFYGASSLNAQLPRISVTTLELSETIWQGSMPLILKQLSDFTGFEEDALKDKATEAFDRFKDYFKNRKSDD